MKATATLAAYAAKAGFEDFPSTVVKQAKTNLLNNLGCALGGYQTGLAKKYINFAKELDGKPESTVIGDGSKVGCAAAAFTNSYLSMLLDYDDMLYYIVHPGISATPSALAVGERVKATGKDVLTAMILGYEVSGRIAIATQPSSERGERVWGISSNTFAAVVPAAKLLGFDADKMEIALGIAGAYAPVPSAWKYFGKVDETRPMREIKLCWGWMTMGGVFGALLAAHNIQGGYGVLDGDEGWWIMAGSDRCDFPRMIQGLGEDYEILRTEIKAYPSCGWTHPPCDALRSIMAENEIKPGSVEEVTVTGMKQWTERMFDQTPTGIVDAEFSIPYSMALTLLGESLGPEWYSDRRLNGAEVKDLMKKVKLATDPAADELWFNQQIMATRVDVKTKDGKRFSAQVAYPQDKPAFDEKETKAKFKTMATPVLADRQVTEIIRIVDELEKLKNIGELTYLLSPHPL